MKYRAFKKCTKDYDEEFTREKETKELQIQIGDKFALYIEEHQMGIDLTEPHIEFVVSGKGSYSMDLSEFIKLITR